MLCLIAHSLATGKTMKTLDLFELLVEQAQ